MPRTTARPVRGSGEDRIVRLLAERFGGPGPMLRQGIGDDAAVIRPRGAAELWVVTTDLLLEGIDFRRSWTRPEQLGHRALAVNLSDIAAMGARPRFYTVALGLPRDCRRGWIDRFYQGMTALGRRHRAHLVGGDLSASQHGIHVSVTVLGESLARNVVLRSGGRAGDLLYVTGTLGKSAAGLELLERGRRRASPPARAAIAAHLWPEPRCDAGLWLTRRGFARAMIDLSDGLSVDLPRLARASGTGAEVAADRLPVFAASGRWGADPLRLALDGGDDYELLVAVRSRDAARLEAEYPRSLPPLTRIGRLASQAGVRIARGRGGGPSPLPPRGHDHFRGGG
ncbi:MAG: thiamine-phosphate kinase [Acidobacteria bacterium]|nr:MAG: thiamine-phosphate kinase [Acidobacteriota bacterium]